MNKIKNICIITNLAPWKYGGIETVIRELNEELTKLGYKFTIFCHDKQSIIKKFKYGTVYCIKERIPYLGILLPDFSYALNILNKRFDTVHAHYQTLWYPLLRRFIKKIPYIVTFHGATRSELEATQKYLSFDGKVRRIIGSKFEKFSANSADVVVACSKALKKDLIRMYKIPERKIRVIYNGVDTKKFKPLNKMKCREKLGLEKDIFYGITVMTDPKRKGIDVLLKIIELLKKSGLKKIKIIVIGQKGVDTDYVKFYERIPYDDLIFYYNSADFFIYPSISDGGGIALVNLIALACGKPPIVSKNSNLEYVKNGREGFIIDKYDPNLYLKKILFLAENKSILKLMSEAARKTALKFSWKNQAKEYDKLYRELLNKYEIQSPKR